MRTAKGFTILEILIVIAIILLLLGIGVYGVPKVLGMADEKNTETVLAGLDSISVEMYALHGSYKDKATLLDPLTGTTKVFDLDDLPTFLQLARGSKNTEAFIGKIPQDYLMKVDPTAPADPRLYAIDGYDGMIFYVHPAYHNSVVRDTNDDGDTSDPDDIAYDRLPKKNVPYFASAGRDGEWGDVRELHKRTAGNTHDAQLAAEAEDNVYSFEQAR